MAIRIKMRDQNHLGDGLKSGATPEVGGCTVVYLGTPKDFHFLRPVGHGNVFFLFIFTRFILFFYNIEVVLDYE